MADGGIIGMTETVILGSPKHTRDVIDVQNLSP
jgi:hypothetical protein